MKTIRIAALVCIAALQLQGGKGAKDHDVATISPALDHFYGDPLNRPIPIVFAFIAIMLRVEGADAGAQEKALAILREDAAPAKP
jgi:hypothetical protein